MKHRALMLTVMMVTLLALAVGAVAVLADFGTNWTAQYFNNADLVGTPVITESAPQGVNFNWGTGSPNPVIPPDRFSARFTSVQNLAGGTYEFIVTSDDGVRLIIDNVLVLDRFIPRVQTTDRVQVQLTPGPHSLIVEYFEDIDLALISVQWAQIDGPTPFPTSGAVFPPGTPFGTQAATPGYTGPIATVSGPKGLALRTGPFLGASFVTTLPGGASYPVLARNFDEGIYNWYYLQVGDRFGWSSGRFLQISVDPLTLPVQGSIFDQINDAPDRGVVATTRAQMNVRTRPSERMPVIGQIPWGGQVPVIGRTVQAGTDRWYQVRLPDGQVGWIAAPWVGVRGERLAVPIR
ncbi:MAG TPA: SH3 domain-containing protein [Candidatus Limnocylindrales bacterium]|nr:SH3 domain-containing protein [Candidatus Limnocylindrales bacterium]